MSKATLSRIFLRTFTTLAQWILAATFLFSGFVKALDPMGMEHKLEAYCASWGISLISGDVLLDIAVVILILVEFTLGVYLILGMRQRLAAYGAFTFMLVMTAVTTYIYLYNPVSDCGCFGDALVLTHGETLAKNIVLLLLAIWLICHRQRQLRIISQHNQWLLSLYAMVYLLGVSLYSLHYLPLVDFTGFGLGINIRQAMMGKYRTTFIYERNGTQQTFDENNLPDSTWTYVSAETITEQAPSIKEFSFTDRHGEDWSEQLLSDTNFVFIATAPHLSTADTGCSDALNDLYDYCTDHKLTFVFATTGSNAEASQWIDHTGAAYPIVTGSSEMLKAMVRSNPGLMLLKDGRILAKWSNHNMPDESEFARLSRRTAEEEQSQNKRAFAQLALWFVIPFLLLLLLDSLWIGKRYLKVISHYKSQKTTLL